MVLQNDLEISRIRRIADQNKIKLREQVQLEYDIEQEALEKKQAKL